MFLRRKQLLCYSRNSPPFVEFIHIHSSPRLAPVLRQMNIAHTPTIFFTSPHLLLGLQSGIFLSSFLQPDATSQVQILSLATCLKTPSVFVRFEVLTVVNVKIAVPCNVPPRGLVRQIPTFRRIMLPTFARYSRYTVLSVPPKFWYLSTELHGVTS